jgi:hypothetical protein
MPRTLRQHVEEAERIMSILGVRTLIPQKGLPAPVKVDAGNLSLEYAVSVRVIVERYDRTGWAGDYLRASEEAASEVWERIPNVAVCPLCMGRTQEKRFGRVLCVPCETFVKPRNLRGLVSADLRAMRKALRDGGISVEGGRE